MKEEFVGLSSEELFYEAAGCGCCTSSKSPRWEDVKAALREEIAKEIEKNPPTSLVISPLENPSNPKHIRDAVVNYCANLVRGKNDTR